MVNNEDNRGEDRARGPSSKKHKPRGPYKKWLGEVGGRPPRSTVQSRSSQRLETGSGNKSPPSTETGSGNELPPSTETGNGDESIVSRADPAGQSDVNSDSADYVTSPGTTNKDVNNDQNLAGKITPEYTGNSLCVGLCVCGSCDSAPPPDHPTSHPEFAAPISTADLNSTSGSATWKTRVRWDEPFLPFIPTTTFETYLMVLHLSIRHSMTGPLIEDILKLINMVVGEKAAIPTTHYYFRKLFHPKADMQCHFYCQTCESYLGEKSNFESKTVVPCNICSEESCNVSELSGNFFVTFSIKEQIEYVAMKPEVEWVSREGRQEGVYKDVIDGQIYRKLCQPGQLLQNPNSLTLTFNTDGAQVFRSIHGSLWPIQAICNEIRPEVRFKRENVMLLGLWFGKGIPNMTAFLKPFQTEMNSLKTDGPSLNF